MKTLTIIGGGQVGKTLGFLLANNNCYRIQDILCRSHQNALDAATFIGEGRAITNYQDLKAANVILLAVNDDQLANAVSQLQTANLTTTEIIFHCNGSFSHEILLPLKNEKNSLASIHPIKSFSQPDEDYKNFKGTYCTLEGEEQACNILREQFKLIGSIILEINPKQKMICHIAAIFSSNYLVTLLDISLQLFETIGISQAEGIALLEPLALGAFEQVKRLGAAKALTGPIARGDGELVAEQINLLKKEAESLIPIYKTLGRQALKLAARDRFTDYSLLVERLKD